MYKKLIIAIFLIPFNAYSSSSKARDIMKKVYDQASTHKTQKASCFMVITTKAKEKRERFFKYKVLHKNSNKNSLIKFYKPSTVKGTGLLSQSTSGSDQSNQWLYLPAFKSVKRLSASDKNASFMGSDFSYVDIAGRGVDQDTHSMISEDKGKYIIQSIPKNNKDKYKKIISSIHKTTMVPISIEFHDAKGKLKTLVTKKVKKVKGVFMVTKNQMSNHRTKGNTLIEMNNIKVGMKINYNEVAIKGLKEN